MTQLRPLLTCIAAFAVTLAAPVLTWWSVGDLSVHGYAAKDLDYAVQPPRLSPATESLLGALALGVMAVGGATFVIGILRTWIRRSWLAVLALLVVAGAVTGWAWRVMTAGVIGANIGAGIAVLLGGGAVLVLVSAAVARGAYLVLHGRTSAESKDTSSPSSADF
ncbi:hypothetical protein ABZ468_16905 [Streptomyces sp. NPDC005708]|uniref:hypothetical protein n=1 Tax=Streptomyces sp. NPDC005708 TaxID=3154564 RepID=UPI0033D0738F